MQIKNKETYYNSIYQAVIVNTDSSFDSNNTGKVQIYIPEIQYQFASIYKTYMDLADKSTSDAKDKFPWAVAIIEDLEEGDIVYGSYVNNENGEYIIIGKLVDYSDNLLGLGGRESFNISVDASDILGMAMPIIIHNEVGISTTDWPDNIPTSRYTSINPYDNGGWSIGLIQWHHTRAYDCCYYIATRDSAWQSRFTDKSLDLYTDLCSSINSASTTHQRTKYQSNYHPTAGTSAYTSIQNLLGSDAGKIAQREYAQADTKASLDILQGDPYNIQNPALLIYLLDIMNQYGNGISSKAKAATISNNGKSTMEQLEEFRAYWKAASNNMYTSRRDTTYAYIVELEKQGKFNKAVLCDIEGANEGGQILWPAPSCKVITSYYGSRKNPTGSGTQFHSGIDLAKNGGALGEPIIAAHSGTVTTIDYGGKSYGTLTTITNGEMTTYYAHQCRRESGIVTGATVQAGQVIGYVGSTGNSTGPHLHFEVRINGSHTNPLPYIKA